MLLAAALRHEVLQFPLQLPQSLLDFRPLVPHFDRRYSDEILYHFFLFYGDVDHTSEYQQYARGQYTYVDVEVNQGGFGEVFTSLLEVTRTQLVVFGERCSEASCRVVDYGH